MIATRQPKINSVNSRHPVVLPEVTATAFTLAE